VIVLDTDGGRFNYRVAGVCIHEGHVLLHRIESMDFWIMPGGRAELYESSWEALLREMREELGSEVTVDRLLWIVENFFNLDGRRFHELAFYYQFTLPDEAACRDVRREFSIVDGGVTCLFRWFPLVEVAQLPIFPTFLRTALTELPLSPEHVIHTDPEK
jgi:8-oxo-dGTP pyrophosphatase MutT (NUDIX family)